MSDSNDLTRRDFLVSASLVAGATAVSDIALLAQPQTPTAPPSATNVDMGSVFPAGGVYFRKSNPPAADWAKDHKTAAQIGMNTFRHWLRSRPPERRTPRQAPLLLRRQQDQAAGVAQNPLRLARRVAKTWHRPGFSDWEDIQPPYDFAGYPENLDWLEHRVDKAYALFDWRIALYRRLIASAPLLTSVRRNHLVLGHIRRIDLDPQARATRNLQHPLRV